MRRVRLTRVCLTEQASRAGGPGRHYMPAGQQPLQADCWTVLQTVCDSSGSHQHKLRSQPAAASGCHWCITGIQSHMHPHHYLTASYRVPLMSHQLPSASGRWDIILPHAGAAAGNVTSSACLRTCPGASNNHQVVLSATMKRRL